MDKNVKKAWVEALRSGKYYQHKGDMDNVFKTGKNTPPTAFCCLGVLNQLVGYAMTKTKDGHFTWACGEEEGRHLIKMNDGEGMPQANFNEIADWIELNVKED